MSTPRTAIMATATVAGLFLAACGADDSAAGSNAAIADGATVEVIMTDMAFTPTVVQMHTGDTVTFRFRNDGKVMHEAVIGDALFQAEHAAEMAAMGSANGSMNHGDADEMAPLVVQPGETGELIYTATTAGSLLIGCHQPGHWEFGMKATIDIV